jgi:tetratricopeptide (TPR) repeat protein
MIALLCGRVASAAEHCPAYVRSSVGGDYNDPVDRIGLPTVEGAHFTSQVEDLVRGDSGYLGTDIAYTLEHFPNHPRALSAMAQLALRQKSTRAKGARYSVSCYFDRAMRFRPADARVRSLLGAYLLALKQDDAALVQFEASVRLAPGDAVAHYNLGLLYERRKDYPKAREAAHAAYGMDFPLPGLKNKLKAAGQWQD